MKKRVLMLILVMAMLLSVTAFAVEVPTEQQVYQSMIAMKAQYPEGKRWTNDDYYEWRGDSSSGYGCAAFTRILSDAAFGDLEAYMTDYSFDTLRVGDIIRSAGHEVIVLEKRSDGVVVAEGNYNSSIHWGRFISREKLDSVHYFEDGWVEPYVVFVYTRWPPACWHEYVQTDSYWPGCEGDGFYEYTCTLCGDVMREEYTQTGHHDWSSWNVEKRAVGYEAGIEVRSCAYCDKEEARRFFTVANPFTDVKEDDYFVSPVLWAVDNAVTTGMTSSTFAPAATCTRGQIITFLWREAGSPVVDGAVVPDDVAADQYYYPAVAWAYAAGMAEGETFRPEEPCTRAEAVWFLWKQAGSPKVRAHHPFIDVADGSRYEEAVGWALKAGITTGATATTFAPENTCTRGQIVTFLYRGLK